MTRIKIADLQVTQLQSVSTQELDATKGGFFFKFFWGGWRGYGYGHGRGYSWGWGRGRYDD